MVATILALALSGCGPQSVADAELEVSGKWANTPWASDVAYWEPPDRVVVILGGSSDCRSVVTKVEERGGLVIMTLETTGGPTCFADMVTVPTVFTLEEGRPDWVVLKDGSRDWWENVVDVED